MVVLGSITATRLFYGLLGVPVLKICLALVWAGCPKAFGIALLLLGSVVGRGGKGSLWGQQEGQQCRLWSHVWDGPHGTASI